MRREEFAGTFPGRLVLDPQGHVAFVPDPLPPQLEFGMNTINLLASAAEALGELRAVGHRMPNPNLLISPFLRREAVLSSRIEGTTAGLQQLLLFEADPSAEPDVPDVREVANYVAAQELGFSLLERMPLSLRLIREVHARLLADVRGEDRRPGEFRHIPVWISPGTSPETARFVPPPVKEMRESLFEFERNWGERADELPLLLQLAITHYQFEAIHPFMDGNGRVGRLLIALQLRERDYLPQPLLYLSAFFERHRDEYRDHLLEVSRSGAWITWIDFFLQGIAAQALDTTQRSYQLLDLREELLDWALAMGKSGNLARIVDFLFERPVVSISDVRQRLGVTFRSARLLMQRLVDDDIIHEVTGRKRNRLFAATRVLDIIRPADE